MKTIKILAQLFIYLIFLLGLGIAVAILEGTIFIGGTIFIVWAIAFWGFGFYKTLLWFDKVTKPKDILNE